MNWKTDLKLSDIDEATPIEITCKRCGLTRYETQARLAKRTELEHAYLDEVERMLKCSNRFCRSQVRISLIHDDKTEGFVGGMA